MSSSRAAYTTDRSGCTTSYDPFQNDPLFGITLPSSPTQIWTSSPWFLENLNRYLQSNKKSSSFLVSLDPDEGCPATDGGGRSAQQRSFHLSQGQLSHSLAAENFFVDWDKHFRQAMKSTETQQAAETAMDGLSRGESWLIIPDLSADGSCKLEFSKLGDEEAQQLTAKVAKAGFVGSGHLVVKLA